MAEDVSDDRKGLAVNLESDREVAIYWSPSRNRFDLVMVRPQTENDVAALDIPQHRFIKDGKVLTSVGFSREAGAAICSLLIEWMRQKGDIGA